MGLSHRVILTMILACVLAPGLGVRAGDRASDGTDMGLTIMGAIVQKATENNVALIKETKSGAVKAVKVGFVLLDKFKVIEIHQKYIVLITRDAVRHLVYQDKFAGEFSAGRVASDAPISTKNLALGDSYKEEGFERAQGRVMMSGMFRDKLVKQDLAKVLMQATAEPHFENGSIVGFQFSQIDNDSIFAKGGMMNNDIVTSINGQKLNNVAGAISLMRSLKNSDQLEVEIIRGGTPTKITVSVSN